MRRFLLSSLMVVGATFILTSPASGVVVLLKNNSTPVTGYLISQDAQKVVLREVARDGSVQVRNLPTAEIDELIVSVSADRLAALRPEAPREYYDYAEELAEKRQDPEARDTALRLYHIAAFSSPNELGRRSLLGMAGLARGTREEMKFRALAYLLDPAKDRTVLKPATELTVAKTETNPTARQALLLGIRQLRRAEPLRAKREFERPGVKDEFATLHGALTYDECMTACAEKTVGDALLRRILIVELALMNESAPAGPAAAEPVRLSWSAQLKRTGGAALPVLDLEKATEFDPRENRFRDGRWSKSP